MTKTETVDAVVVGAGAGGGCVAKTLAAHGLRTLLLERGDRLPGDRFAAEDLSSQRNPWLTQGPGPLGARTHTAQYVDNGDYGVVSPCNAACVGSGTTFYGGLTGRFLEADFRLRSRFGGWPESSVEDWPITYAELEPFYDRAENGIGVSGTAEGNPFAALRSSPYPMKPFPLTPEAQRVREAGLKRGLHPFPAAYLRNSEKRNGRPACTHQGACDGFPCPVGAKNGTANTVIADALSTRNCELRTQAMVTKLLVDDAGRLTGLIYVDGEDAVHEVRAKAVVLAAGSNATARLLLASTSKLFPKGAGNNADQVGRNLVDLAVVEARGFTDDNISSLGSHRPGAGVALMDFCHRDANGDSLGGGMLYTDFPLTPAQFAQLEFPGMPTWGREFQNFVSTHYRRLLRVRALAACAPCAENRLRLDPKRHDYWGVPLLACEGRECVRDREVRRFLGERAKELAEAAGAKSVSVDFDDTRVKEWRLGGPYQGGSCRMGVDEEHGVCDAWGRVWDFPNLFIADSSLLVNHGSVPPALTVMALAFRVGEGVINNWRRL